MTRNAYTLLLLLTAAVLACGAESGEEDVTFAFGAGKDSQGNETGADSRSPGNDVTVTLDSEEPEETYVPPEDAYVLPEDLAAEVEACVPECDGKECGDDGCGGFCGTCPLAAPLCVNNMCQVECLPDCTGKNCGDDGCGGLCGTCPLEAPDCLDGLCGIQCQPDCYNKECGDDGCGGSCGTCPAAAPLCEGFICHIVCQPDCIGKVCGDDGCGGLCGQCPEGLPMCDQGICKPDPADGCTEAGKQIFLVTEGKTLLRFEPETLNIVIIGTLNCPAGWGESPYSMSVDRNSNAWVLYSDGSLWKVNTEDASCQATAFTPNQLGFELFGMGFSTDAPNTSDETLFIAGGDYMDLLYGDATLGFINLDSLAVTSIASFVPGSRLPELTGTREAELWGFFPETNPPRVARIDKGTAGQSLQMDLPPAFFSNVNAWAFAHWGGDFFIFFKSQTDVASSIWKVSGGDGSLTQVVPNTGHVITGAGVSTCAPTNSGP